MPQLGTVGRRPYRNPAPAHIARAVQPCGRPRDAAARVPAATSVRSRAKSFPPARRVPARNAAALAGRGPGPRVDCAPGARRPGNTAAPGECSAASHRRGGDSDATGSPGPRGGHGAKAKHSARVPFLDGAGFAGRDRHDRARRRGRAARSRSLRHGGRGLELHRSRNAAARRTSATMARRRRGRSPPTERAEIRLYTAAVLRQMPEEPLQPVPMGQVFLADDEDVASRCAWTATSKPESRTGIPVGRVPRRRHRLADLPRRGFSPRPRGRAPQHHRRVRPGDEDQRRRVDCCSSHLRALPGEQGVGRRGVLQRQRARTCCFLDQPGELDDATAALYEKLRRAAGAVRERALLRAVQAGRLLAEHAALERGAARTTSSPLTWGLREVLQFAEVLLNKDDVDAKADALIDFIRERVVDREFSDALLGATRYACGRSPTSRSGSRTCCRAMRAERTTRAGARTTSRRSARCATGCSNISTRCAGLVTDDGDGERPAVRQLRGSHGVRGRRRQRSRRTRRT